MTLFFQLLIGHALADFVLQSDTMARAKDLHGEFAKEKSENFPAWSRRPRRPHWCMAARFIC
jgi:hypothetical protein